MDNLQDAFVGESQANRKYLAFAKKAEGEGFVQVAKFFRSEAKNSTCYKQLRVMGGIKENLQDAIGG